MSTDLSAKPWWLACWHQWFAERALRRRGVTFRSSSADVVEAGYDAMEPDEFDAVNGRQEWANWRILRSLLTGRLPEQPLNIVDLGCGTGASTQALAACCPSGSQIMAFERSARLLKRARARDYRSRGGVTAAVELRQQSIAEPWRHSSGTLLLNWEFDLIVSCGVLGHHFNRWTSVPVFAEIRRVLRPDGLACLDAGPSLRRGELIKSMASIGFRPIAEARSCLLDRNRQLLFQAE